ncbi:MAG: carbohydrate porin, partial [Planctomycetaceae bacterium]|nr:carbohydrate porin [Planctomycetaceae bacterium]
FAGKMDTLDGDLNAFAHGRGKTQFSNMGFIFNPIVGATVPYSTLGAGFFILDGKDPRLMFAILNAEDTSNTSGIRELFNDGLLLSTSLRLPTSFFGQPGHQLFGGTWNGKTYFSIGDAYLDYPNVIIPTTRGSWCLYWNGDHYLVSDRRDPARGWGLFGRAGIADPNTSPIAWYVSAGLGGNGFNRRRPDDSCGVGWYYAGLSSQIGPLITAQFGPVRDGQGIECYYNYHWTPAIRITPDLQVIIPSLSDNRPALLLGVRTQVVF